MKNEYTCIIIDDEEYAIGLLTESIQELYSNVSILGTYTRWKDGIEALRSLKADIVFLDISIEGKNGLNILKIIPGIESEVIFVTAYSEYALDAFKIAASGYLVKPVSQEDLSKTVDKAIERISLKRTAHQRLNGISTLGARLSIPNGKGIDYMDTNDVIYFEALRDYTKIVGKDKYLVSSNSIGKFAYVLEDSSFFQVHRSFIVNVNYILRYETSGVIIMCDKKEIPVARNLREQLLKLFSA
jgi:two-component system, LytTR family, response regulator